MCHSPDRAMALCCSLQSKVLQFHDCVGVLTNYKWIAFGARPVDVAWANRLWLRLQEHTCLLKHRGLLSVEPRCLIRVLSPEEPGVSWLQSLYSPAASLGRHRAPLSARGGLAVPQRKEGRVTDTETREKSPDQWTRCLRHMMLICCSGWRRKGHPLSLL